MHRTSSALRAIARAKPRTELCHKPTRYFTSRVIASKHFIKHECAPMQCDRVLSNFNQSQYRSFSSGSLPEHIRVTLPALSPTMETGTILSWVKSEGESVSEGDLLAEIETDKATMGFEAGEEGFIGKIVIPAGTKDIPLGKLMCIIVPNEEDIAAFKNFEDGGELSPGAPVPPIDLTEATADTASTDKAYPEHKTVNLPALSPTMEAGSIGPWAKQIGDSVNEGELLVQIETDKATMDFEVTEEGFLACILLAEGTKDVPLGTPLCVIVENEEDVAAFADYTVPVGGAAKKPSKPAPEPVKKAAAALPPAPAVQAAPVATPSPAPAGSRVFASPKAKKLANEKGIDLKLVKGTGPDGRVRAKDIESFVPPAAAPAPVAVQPTLPAAPKPAAAAGDSYIDIPLTNMRKTIAKRLVESKQSIPHYYLSIDVNVDQVVKLRAELNELLSADKLKLSVNDFIIKAAAIACKRVPEANSSWQDTYIRQHNVVDINVAVATDAGLITPIVTSADMKGLASINQDVQQLAAKARDGKLQPHEFMGGTFTISNLGMFGIKNFSAIINPPQACILAVGSAQPTLLSDSDAKNGYRATSLMSVTLSCDHRVVDGAVGARWLAEFKKLIEKPHTMLI